MPIGLFVLMLLAAIPLLAASPQPEDPLAGSTLEAGFVDIHRNVESGSVIIGVRELDQPFLLVTSLPGGLGSNDIGLDRGQVGKQYLVRFKRVGQRLLLIADNTRFVADSTDSDERQAAIDAFAPSVLWAAPIIQRPANGGRGKGNGAQTLLVDIGPYLTGDRHGIAAAMGGTQGISKALEVAEQGSYKIDPERSAVLPEAARSFPDNSEFEALLTFTGPGTGEFVNQVAVDPGALTLRQHISFVRLPPPGYVPRPFHPASGAFSSSRIDFAQPLTGALDVRWQPRFRLRKGADGKVIEPIVFHLDRGTPEPIRSALLDGARWWTRAFDEAGFPGGYRVELMPEGADPMDIRYNTITWTHRATRGWSYGLAIVDPRTGEIIKGAVNLGSQRVRQDILIAEALLAPFDKADSAARSNEAQQMALSRLRQLSAHEIGHTLGFNHNFAASRNGNGSVMDYPHPLIELDASGAPRLADAYGVGLGDWDLFLVKHGYGDHDGAALAQLREQIRAAGYQYLGDHDARVVGDAHAAGVLWDLAGGDPLAGFDRIMRARKYALGHFSSGVLPPTRQLGELEARLVPVYLLHRYQTDAVARLLGGVSYRYGLAGDTPAGATPVDAATQHQARDRLLLTFSADTLALPSRVLDLMTPPGPEYARDREYFATRATPLFDPLGAADAAAAVTLQSLLSPPRLQRMLLQHSRDPALPGVRDSIDALLAATWKAAPNPNAHAALVQRSVNWVVLDALLAALDGGALHPTVDSEIRASLFDFSQWATRSPANADRASAADRVRRYLADPTSVKLRPLPVVPPGAPI
jgi:hypothetical protein